MTAVRTHRSAEEIGRTERGPRELPALGRTAPVPLPEVVTGTLPNGLTVIAARRPGVPLVETVLRIPAASPADSAEAGWTAGMELVAETMLTGTASRDRVGIDDELAGVGAELGVGVDPEWLQVGGSALASGLPVVLDVLADVLTGATHPDDEVFRERSRLAERIAVARAQPRTVAREALMRRRFGDHPIVSEMPTAAAVAGIAPERVRELHAGTVVPGGARLVLVGDIDPQAAIAEVTARLGGWSDDHPARRLTAPPMPSAGDLELVHRPGSVQSQIRLTAPGLDRTDERYTAFQLANLVFGGYFSSRWMENVREDKGYTYGAHSGQEFVPGGAVLGLDVDVASDVTAAALLETRYELGRMIAVPPTEQEVESARRYAIGSLLISLDSQSALAGTLSALDAVGLGVDWLRDRPQRLEAVTVEQVAEAAAELFAPARFTGVVVGDAEAIGSRLAALGGVSLP
ncbi:MULTISPECIES: M16 family metallopeptidase [Pseudonocardia]|uniref:Peptidase M16 inactive domain protein n=2 Tax=Pseudonocardia TaxID=1847 RepID=A0A1Y2N5Y3_PSEAH|nr:MULTISPECIES: pitrilysin family protein [Pseudonocardia]OSY42517.1 Peptidase M16 inactive domain protein [Pseudonocardia autotrophica]TDN76036.1 putative Zn-dependent peptidase [Pseudonocardia autotrophica]BBG00013.1 peptidase M16 [Pseudonocardia autotrophica]GEC25072.1 peptidase M16 [Pseudonocardia saturnea]